MTYDVATYRNAIVNDVFESPNILFTLSRRSAQRRGSAASVAYLITGFFLANCVLKDDFLSFRTIQPYMLSRSLMWDFFVMPMTAA